MNPIKASAGRVTLRIAAKNPAACTPAHCLLSVSPIAFDPDGKPGAVRLETEEEGRRVWIDISSAAADVLVQRIRDALGRA